jgi:MFS family permease/DNA-binding transcriptional MerR regulator
MAAVNPARTITVRDAAARLGVTPRTLKYYEELGIVVPVRSEGGYSLYEQADLDKLARVLRMRSLGFSLTVITAMLQQPVEQRRPTADVRAVEHVAEDLARNPHRATANARRARGAGAPRAQGSRRAAGAAAARPRLRGAPPGRRTRRGSARTAPKGEAGTMSAGPGVAANARPSPILARQCVAVALLPWAIGLVTAIDYFDNALFAFFASYIAGGVNASPDELVWASSAYALGAVLGILHQHAWIERLGYRRYLAVCMFAFAAGGVGAALCDSAMQLTAARALQGYFVGPMLGACRILIQIGIPPARRAKALKAFMVLIVFGGALAPIAGAFLVTNFDWRWLFASTAPVAALIGLLVLWTLPDIGDVPVHERTEPHYLAYVVFALAQAALQVVLTRSHFELFTGSPALIGLTIAGVAGLAWFGWQQWRHPAPLVRLHAFRMRRSAWGWRCTSSTTTSRRASAICCRG